MNILLANTTCKIGGVSTFMVALWRQLVTEGHTCRLFFFEHGPMEAHLPADCPVHFGSLADLLRLVARDGIDVVHANNVDWPTGIAAVRELGAVLVLTAHKVREPAWTYGWTARNADAFVTVSSWIGDALRPYTDAAIHVVPNGIDTGRFNAGDALGRVPTGPPIVAWVGRASAPRKRLEAFAAAAPLLVDAGLRIWVIDQQGPETFAQAHPAAAQQLQRVAERWEGVDFDRMPAVYREIAGSGGAILSTASMEGLPLSILEAQACGCLAIGADVRGVNECISPAHGGLLYPLDLPAHELAARVVTALGNPDQVRRDQHATVAYVAQRFSLERLAGEYLAIYRGVASATTIRLPPSAGSRRLSMVTNWRGYVEQRVGVGYNQYNASNSLARSGEWQLAAAAARAALATSPTIFARPHRVLHFIAAHVRGIRGRSLRSLPASP